jgi:hypothetical protein
MSSQDPTRVVLLWNGKDSISMLSNSYIAARRDADKTVCVLTVTVCENNVFHLMDHYRKKYMLVKDLNSLEIRFCYWHVVWAELWV